MILPAIFLLGCKSLTPTLSVNTTEITAQGTGGKYEISYTLEDAPFSPDSWTVECDADWITGYDFASQGVISLEVRPNDLLEARSTTLVLSYSGVVGQYHVTINQEAGSIDMADIVLEQDEVMVSDEGGQYTVKYTIKNPIVGINVEVNANVPWITSVRSNVEGEVTFNTRWNFAGVRETEITLVYGDKIERSFKVIQQQGSSEKAFKELSVSDIKQASALMKVVPSDNEMYYGVLSVNSSSLVDVYDSPEACVEEWLSGMNMVAGFVGTTLEDLLRSDLPKGQQILLLSSLSGGTEISVLVFGIEPSDQSYLTDIFIEEFVTEEVPMSDIKFDLSIDVQGAMANLSVVPSDNQALYYVNVEEAGIYNPQGTIDYYMFLYAVMGMTIDDAIVEMCISGTNTVEFSLEPNKDYIAYACTINNEGLINCEIATLEFATGEIQMSDNKFEITVTNITGTSAEINVDTFNDDYYVIAVDSPKIFDGMSDEEVIAEYIKNNPMYCDMMTRRGDISETVTGLTPNTEYVAFAFGCYLYTPTTRPVKVVFKTTSEAGNVSLKAPVAEKKGIKALDTEDMRKRYEMERYLRMLGR